MYRRINLAEMRGMFFTSSHAKFIVVSDENGHLLTLDGCVLLTFRGEVHVFKSVDSMVVFVKRHFVNVCKRIAVLEVFIP